MNRPKAVLYSIFIVGFAAGLTVGELWLKGLVERWSAIAPASEAAAPALGAPAATPSGLISIADQPAGSSVSVQAVKTSETVWIAVREVGPSGLGSTLGALRIAGGGAALTVPLLRATAPDTRYAVELYRDDAGGRFDPSQDSVYIDASTGGPAIAYFATRP